MNVSLTPELEEFVNGMLASGRYQSASEVFRDGLRLLEETERQRILETALVQGITPADGSVVPASLVIRVLEQARVKIREGMEAAQRGELHDGESVKRELMEHSLRRRALGS